MRGKGLIKLAVSAILIIGVMIGAYIYSNNMGSSDKMTECSDCGGVGYCADCYGKDEECETCHGTNVCATCEGTGEVQMDSTLYATVWALVPPIIAIALALITKEVYSSLFIGIVSGAILTSFGKGGVFLFNVGNGVVDGFIGSLADSWNVGILIFLVMLGTIVVLMNRAGGSEAYGNWATRKISTKRGGLLSTMFLGILIFVDDYFNCLTVGSVMRPVTDKQKISREKLAYIIDSTAAPICMIAPISSWAAAVAGVVEGDENGLNLFIRAIPYNLYSILTIVMMVVLIAGKFDYGPMKKAEMAMANSVAQVKPVENTEDKKTESKGKVVDLIFPVILLIVCCVIGMVYTGGVFDGVDFVSAFANCDASYGLALGSGVALILIIVYMLCRKTLAFDKCMSALPEGFKAMVPAILILSMAWTLGGMTKGSLGAAEFVSSVFESNKSALMSFMPVAIFVVSVGLSFSTGTSWGTFGILLPIVVPLFTGEMLTICISACLAGAVCGDHCSPISDTTIMASTGADCDHVKHVSTQLPYSLTVAAVCIVGYIIAGFCSSLFVILPVSIVLMVATLLVIRHFSKEKTA